MSNRASFSPGRWLLGSVAVLATAAALVVIGRGAWAEPGITVGLVLGLAAAGRLGLLRDGVRSGAEVGRAAFVAVIVISAAACVLAYLILLDGTAAQDWLRRAGDVVRQQGTRFLPAYSGGVAALGLVCLLLLARPGHRSWRWWARLADSAAVGLAVALGLELVLADGAPAVWTVALVVPCGLVLARVLWPALMPTSGRGLADPRQWPRWLVLPLLLALLALGHLLAARLLRCPEPGDVPGLTRIAVLPEVFGIALGRDGDAALLSLPGSGCLARMRLQPEPGPVHVTDPGPIRSMSGPHWQLDGEIGAVVHAPALDRFLAAFEPRELDLQRVDRGAIEAEGPIASLILYLSGDGSRVIHGLALPGLCRIGALRWDNTQPLLEMDCADGSGTHRLDPEARALRDDAPTGGGSAGPVLVFDASRDDGRLRMRDPVSRELLGCLPVGGHVSDVVVDRSRGLAYFWSQCGLYRLELDAWLARR